jgi:hypothetical protein
VNLKFEFGGSWVVEVVLSQGVIDDYLFNTADNGILATLHDPWHIRADTSVLAVDLIVQCTHRWYKRELIRQLDHNLCVLAKRVLWLQSKCNCLCLVDLSC